jgi:rSAM/selenodomain-associated transferase 2
MDEISIIIPTLNEEERIGSLLKHIRSFAPNVEIIVVDGGSRDRTVARSGRATRVVQSARGRAAQMNAGARMASGDVLWFIHADCVPHRDSITAIRIALKDSCVRGGGFEFALDSPGLFFRLVERLSNLKNRLAGMVYGDMGIFIRADVFRSLGGFADLPLMEDMDICRRLKRKGKIAILPQRISTSARRWIGEGAVRNLVRNWCLQIAWVLGASPATLARYYHTTDGDDGFDRALARGGMFPLKACGIETLQVNFGYLCNLTCHHCHVDAGPNRKESIGRATLESCLRVIGGSGITTVDLTGGAPELNPHFRWFVTRSRDMGRDVIVRTNLVVLLEPEQEDLGRFFQRAGVRIIASLPCYTAEAVDSQRGDGVYARSVHALKLLNELGYGREGSGLLLDLAYNPEGTGLPGNQDALEADYKRELNTRHGITFNRLLTLTNLPIGRFRRTLDSEGRYGDYLNTLAETFNPSAAAAVMCRRTISVGFDGAIYDCDFNQMLGMTCDHGAPNHIDDFDVEALSERRIVTGAHCFGCTAGAGSGCGGALVP